MEKKLLPESFTSILWAISFKKPLVSCQMSSKQFAVSTLGEIFPCHMDVGKECLNLGNIGGKNIFNSCTIQKSFPLFDLLANKRGLCPNCWARNLCDGCPRDFFMMKRTNAIRQLLMRINVNHKENI